MAATALAPSGEDVATAAAIAAEWERRLGHPANCRGVTAAVESALGWYAAEGVYEGPEVDHEAQHAWNVTDDGWIVDATVRQYDPSGPAVRVVGPGDPRAEWYWDET